MKSQTSILESRVKLQAWKVGIKKRLLERKLQHEQVQIENDEAKPGLRILFFFVMFSTNQPLLLYYVML
jgi:hypothetical protein